MFVTAEKIHAVEALRIGFVDAVEEDTIKGALTRIATSSQNWERMSRIAMNANSKT